MPLNGIGDYMVVWFLFFEESLYCFPMAGAPFGLPPTEYTGSYFFTSVITAILACVRWYLIVVLIYISLMVSAEKAMAPDSSTLAWKIPWMEEPGRLQSMGSQIVGHNWATSLSLFTFMHWRRKWQPTPVFLPGESQGWRSLVGCCLWGRTESDTTEAT